MIESPMQILRERVAKNIKKIGDALLNSPITKVAVFLKRLKK